MKRFILAAVGLSLLVGAVISPAHAIAAWARRYDTKCSTCHWSLNKLNGKGIEFLKRGFRMPGENTKNDAKKLDLTDYVSLSGTVQYDAIKHGPEPARFATGPLTLYVGGALTQELSVYVKQELDHEHGGDYYSSPADPNRGQRELTASYFFWDPVDSGRYTQIRAGRIIPLMLQANLMGPRLRVGAPPAFDLALSDAYRFDDHLNAVEICRANGPYLVSAGAASMTDPYASSDKDVFATASRAMDPQGSTIGVWYEHLASSGSDNRLGALATLNRKSYALTGAYVTGPAAGYYSADSSGTDAKEHASLVEADYRVNRQLTAFIQMNEMHWSAGTDSGSYRETALGVSKALGGAGRLVSEYSRIKSGGDGGGDASTRWTTELQWMY